MPEEIPAFCLFLLHQLNINQQSNYDTAEQS